MKRLLVALIFVMLPAPAYAQDIQSGLAALERGDYAAALREWRPLAEQGDATAQFNLGPRRRGVSARVQSANVAAGVLAARQGWQEYRRRSDCRDICGPKVRLKA